MAKLNGVNVLDMTDGKIKKVEYDGEQYELTEGDARTGDIVLIIEAREDTTLSAFYLYVGSLSDGDHRLIDDVGELGSNFNNCYRLFRRVKPQPEFKVGDIVTVIGEGTSCNRIGDVGEVTETYTKGEMIRVKVPYRGITSNVHSYHGIRHATYEEIKNYERILAFSKAGRKVNEFREGDIVRASHYGIVEVDYFAEGDPHQVKFTVDNKSNAMHVEGCGLIVPVERRVDLDD